MLIILTQWLESITLWHHVAKYITQTFMYLDALVTYPYCNKQCPWCICRDCMGSRGKPTYWHLLLVQEEGSASREYGKILKHISNRWLSLERCVQRIIEKYIGLKSYFFIEHFADSRFERLCKSTHRNCPVVSPCLHSTVYQFQQVATVRWASNPCSSWLSHKACKNSGKSYYQGKCWKKNLNVTKIDFGWSTDLHTKSIDRQ